MKLYVVITIDDMAAVQQLERMTPANYWHADA